MDHTFGNLNSIVCFQNEFYGCNSKTAIPRLVMLSDRGIAFRLEPGEHIILPELDTYERGACGLVPLEGACQSVRTSGLRWDLHGKPLKFGGLVSTSNQVVAQSVCVSTSCPLLCVSEIDWNTLDGQR